jgi:hypothetical protein
MSRLYLIAATLISVYVPQALASVGSVISSFVAASAAESRNAWAAYRDRRDRGYVYVSCDQPNEIRKFTTLGSLVGSYTVEAAWPLRGADVTHLGPGYMGLCGGEKDFKILSLTTGKVVYSYATSITYNDFFYDGAYYYLKPFSADGFFYRYTTSGEYKGGFHYDGYPPGAWFGGCGYTNRFGGAVGSYVIIDLWSPDITVALTHPAGSLVSAWHSPDAGFGSSCGPGAPLSYGPSFWGIFYNPTEEAMRVYQIDIGGAVPAVTPASVGKIKAIYR